MCIRDRFYANCFHPICNAILFCLIGKNARSGSIFYMPLSRSSCLCWSRWWWLLSVLCRWSDVFGSCGMLMDWTFIFIMGWRVRNGRMLVGKVGPGGWRALSRVWLHLLPGIGRDTCWSRLFGGRWCFWGEALLWRVARGGPRCASIRRRCWLGLSGPLKNNYTEESGITCHSNYKIKGMHDTKR